MPKAGRSLEDYLLHLSDWIGKVEHVERSIASKGNVMSVIDEMALARALEVTGEICGRLISEFPEWTKGKRHLGLDDAYRLRNKLIHGYDSLDWQLLLEIARTSVPALKKSLAVWLIEADG